MYHLCHLSIVPIRKEASDRSEMVSQILFGELAEVLEESGSWLRIKLEYDEYSGWVDKKQLTGISEAEYIKIKSGTQYYSADLFHSMPVESSGTITLVAGSSLANFVDGRIKFSNFDSSFDGKYVETNKKGTQQWLDYALPYLNTPYLWGGRSPLGIDCSGFTQVVLKLCGIRIPRDAYQQAETGIPINSLKESSPGDLAFFKNTEGKIVHVGFILEEGKIIHASGQVRIDKLDEEGIFNSDLNKYSHSLALIKRVL